MHRSNGSVTWESARFSQPIIGVTESIDYRLHNQFVGRHFEFFCTWTVGRGTDISNHSIGNIDQNLLNVDVVLYRAHCDIWANDF